MARRENTVVEDVETVVADDGVEDTTGSEETTEKTPKAKKEPARGELPEGYVTPIGLAKEISARGLHQNRDGVTEDVKPQMVYSYIKNAPKDHPFPLETVQDSLGHDRQALQLEAGVEWWVAKNERAAARKASAAEKAAAKEQRAAEKAAKAEAGEGSEDSTETVDEAE
jgi:hypothetical protein